MADIDGTAGDDQINGTNKADVIDGGDGNDQISSGAGDDVVDGGAGDDHIAAGAGNDIVYGGDGNDKIDAGGGDDVLEGGAGDDFLNGGGGSDTYVFNFSVTPGTGTTSTFPGFDPGSDGVLQQSEFSQQYDAWLRTLGTDGPDANTTVDVANNGGSATDDPFVEGFTGEFADKQSVTVNTGGSNTQTRYYAPSATTGSSEPSIAASDGNDTIAQFQNSGPNVDTIVLKGLAGLTDAQLDALFDLTTSDTNGDGITDTVLSWNGGSITILGTSEWGTDVLAFFDDSRVQLT